MAKDEGRREALDPESDQSFRMIVDQARIRLELPRLMAGLLDRDPGLVHRAIQDWASHARPVSEIWEELRRALGEG